MRFLCFHGLGTNSQVFEAQTVALRFEMDRHYTYDFVEGTLAVPIAPEIKAFYPDTDNYFNYFDLQSIASMRTALTQLSAYVALEGPYDGVLAYSHGATFVATYIVQQAQLHPTSPPPFKCAVFLSGGIPVDPLALEKNELRFLGPKDGKPLKLPTAHIWGANDELFPGTSAILSDLCNDGMRSTFVHEEGHDVPNAKANEAVLGAVRAIRRTVDKALSAQ